MFCKIICFSNIDLEPRFTGCPLGGPACLSPPRPPGGRRLQQNGLLLVRNSNRFCSLSPARFALAALSRHLGHWESWIKKSISLVNASTSVICSAGTACDRDGDGEALQRGLTLGEKIWSPDRRQCSLWNPSLPPCNVPLFGWNEFLISVSRYKRQHMNSAQWTECHHISDLGTCWDNL